MYNRIIIFLITITFISFSALSKKKPSEYPQSEIKVSYKYHEKFLRGNVQFTEREIPMLLLANGEYSKIYSPTTEHKDSLESTPSGRAIANQMFDIAIKKYAESKDEGALGSIVYKTFMYIFKDNAEQSITAYDIAGLGERGVYSEPYSELVWEIGDTTKIVLGYECIKATTNYHGREWTVWFAPEIPIQDGPWKLRGLPGLILEATELKGHHSFVAYGIEQSKCTIYPIYNKDNYDQMSRIEMLQARRHSLDNNHAISKVQTSGMLDLGPDAPVQTEYDFLETDYR